ncbi:MAG: DUF3187 family protein [Candidatus Thiodiazotropha sp.]
MCSGRSLVLGACLMAGLLPNGRAVAQQDLLSEPFSVRNQNPFIIVYGLPSAVPSELLTEDESSLQLQFDVSNNSKGSETPEELIVLDGETYRLAMIYRRGLGHGWQASVELPVIAHGPGVMDNFIEDWHDIFGLSNSDRDPWPKNRLFFSYSRNGEIEAELTDGSTGLGDLQLQVSKQLAVSDTGRHLALHASLKLPTGDADRFQGSGGTDLALWFSGAAPTLIESWRVGGYLQAGLLLLDEGDLLPDQQRSVVWFGGGGVHWRAWPWLMLKAQLDAHSSFYDSELDQLGLRSVMLTVGGSIPVGGDAGAVDLAIGENLSTDTIPDFMINLAYRHRF